MALFLDLSLLFVFWYYCGFGESGHCMEVELPLAWRLGG